MGIWDDRMGRGVERGASGEAGDEIRAPRRIGPEGGVSRVGARK